MNQRNLLILFATLSLLALAAWLLTAEDPAGLGEGDPVLPGLADVLNEVSTITVRRAGPVTVARLERGEADWLLANRNGYPANFARIRENLRALADAAIFEAKTSNPEFYARLGVRDMADANATGTELEIQAPEYSARIIVGRTDEGGGNLAYVRRAGEAQSYLATAKLDMGSGTSDWLETGIVDLPSTRIRSVQISHPDGEIVAIAKPRSESANYTVADVPAGRALTYDGVANTIGAALANLQLDDVQPAADVDAGDVEPILTRFETFDGLTVDVHTWTFADRTVHTFKAEASQATPAGDADAASESTGDGPAASPSDADALATVRDEADTINARVSGWVYTLPSFKAEQLTRRMNDLLAATE